MEGQKISSICTINEAALFYKLLRELMDGPLSAESMTKYSLIAMVESPSRSVYVPIPRTDTVNAFLFIHDYWGMRNHNLRY